MSNIMLITGDKEINRVVKRCLRETPVRVTTECDSAKTAQDLYAKAAAPLVVIDMFIPETSGLEMIKSLKKINENCLFVMLTRLRTRSVIERAFRFGAHDVLVYPVSPDVLRDTILHRLEDQPVQDTEAPEEQAPTKPAKKKSQ